MKNCFDQVTNKVKKIVANTDHQKKAIVAGSVGLVGIAHRLYWGMDKNEVPAPELPELTTEFSELQELEETVIEAAPIVGEDLSFAEAFRQARIERGAGSYFIWKDKVYNTFYKEEWETFSQEEQIAFVKSLPSNDWVAEAHNDVYATTVGEGYDESPANDIATANFVANTHDDASIKIFNTQTVDLNNDGDFEELLSIDSDRQAEIIISEERGSVYAYADTDNDGFLETYFTLDEMGNFVDPQAIAEPQPAPYLEEDAIDANHLIVSYSPKGSDTVFQVEKDLLHDDGIIDSLLIDHTGDKIADEWYADYNGDNIYDRVFYDKDGDGKLDTVASLGPNGEPQTIKSIDHPFPAPSLEDTAGFDIKGINDTTGLSSWLNIEFGEEPGLSNEEDMDDWE